jgi:hypothetical protein
MKRLYTTIILLLFIVTANAQATRNKKNKLIDGITETYSVLVDSPSVKQGRYVAARGKLPIASGVYNHGKRTGTWHFYNSEGKLVQHFNFSTNTLAYEGADDAMPNVKYVVDSTFTKNDTVFRPVKPGGIYYGLLPFVNNLTMPDDLDPRAYEETTVLVSLLISQGGRLADYNVRVIAERWGINKVANMPLNSIDPTDAVFIPATINGEAIPSTIEIYCRVNGSGKIIFAPAVKN